MAGRGAAAGLRLAFMGTPDFAVPALKALIDAGHEIAAVYTQPARPAGRGQKPRPSPVQEVADAAGLEVRSPLSLKSDEELARWRALNLDAAVVVAYGLLLPEDYLKAPRLGCLNIHASLLPRWRGAAPIHRAIMAGDAETGVAIMRMEKGLDTGPVLAERRLAIAADATTQELHDHLADLGAGLIVETLAGLAGGKLQARPQKDEGVTYAAKIDKAEARIDWTQPAEEVDRKVRGLTPFPGAWFLLGEARIKVLEGEMAVGKGTPGAIIDPAMLTIACGKGAYRPTRVQREGKAAMAVADFLRGTPVTEKVAG